MKRRQFVPSILPFRKLSARYRKPATALSNGKNRNLYASEEGHTVLMQSADFVGKMKNEKGMGANRHQQFPSYFTILSNMTCSRLLEGW
jgi:hypothetical protein